MRTRKRITLPIGLICLLVSFAGANGARAASNNVWTLKKIVEAPQVVATGMSADGRWAIYAVRRASVATNDVTTELHLVDIGTATDRMLLRSPWINGIKKIPGSDRFSLLMDIGQGVQLYSLDRAGVVAPLVLSTSSVIIGADPPNAVFMSQDEPSQRFGVLDYGWSPDGHSLWYTTARVVESVAERVAVDINPLVPLDIYRPNLSELHVFTLGGRDKLLASAVGAVRPYPSIVYYRSAAVWVRSNDDAGRPLLKYYHRRDGGDSSKSPENIIYDPVEDKRTIADDTAVPTSHALTASFQTVGLYGHRMLVELNGSNPQRAYGAVRFHLDSFYGPDGKWNLDGRGWVLAVKTEGVNPRSLLARFTKEGRIDLLNSDVSLDHCSFSDSSLTGICIENGINEDPNFVIVDTAHWSLHKIIEIDHEYGKITPLRVSSVNWQERGNSASGFVIYPRDYTPGKRYPAVIITHGVSAYNQFLTPDFQWSYPSQLWSERGYFVVYVNDIPLDATPRCQEAERQWNSPSGPLSSADVFSCIWMNDLGIYRAAIRSLSKKGLIDPAKVGIAGYSRGSQMVNMAVSQTRLFRAASSGDGGYFAPSAYWQEGIHWTWKMLFGGSPFDNKYLRNWRRYAPVFRARRVKAAVLFQVMRVMNTRVDFYHALRDAGVPAEYIFFANDIHLPYKPNDRLDIMNQNLDWFDFWLKGVEDSAPGKRTQYARWEAMRAAKLGYGLTARDRR